MPREMTGRVRFIDGSIRIVPLTDIHWVGEEGSQHATAHYDGKTYPVYKRSDPEWGHDWVEQLEGQALEAYKAARAAERDEEIRSQVHHEVQQSYITASDFETEEDYLQWKETQ